MSTLQCRFEVIQADNANSPLPPREQQCPQDEHLVVLGQHLVDAQGIWQRRPELELDRPGQAPSQQGGVLRTGPHQEASHDAAGSKAHSPGCDDEWKQKKIERYFPQILRRRRRQPMTQGADSLAHRPSNAILARPRLGVTRKRHGG